LAKTTPKKSEQWKDVPEWDGLYEVSDKGRVRNRTTGRILSQQVTRNYYYVCLAAPGRRRRNMSVHRLVLRAFNPGDDSLTVNHMNCNKLDNRIENLEWATYQENNRHAIANGRNDSRGSKNYQAKLTEDAARVIANSNVSLRVLSYMFDTTWSTCSRIRNGKTWAHATGKGRSLTTELIGAAHG